MDTYTCSLLRGLWCHLKAVMDNVTGLSEVKSRTEEIPPTAHLWTG